MNVVISFNATAIGIVLIDDDNDGDGGGDERPDGRKQRDQIVSRAFLMFQPYPGPRSLPHMHDPARLRLEYCGAAGRSVLIFTSKHDPITTHHTSAKPHLHDREDV